MFWNNYETNVKYSLLQNIFILFQFQLKRNNKENVNKVAFAWTTGLRISAGLEIYLIVSTSRPGLKPTISPVQRVQWSASLRGKATEREVNHSPPTISHCAEIYFLPLYIPIYLYSLGKGNFTFILPESSASTAPEAAASFWLSLTWPMHFDRFPFSRNLKFSTIRFPSLLSISHRLFLQFEILYSISVLLIFSFLSTSTLSICVCNSGCFIQNRLRMSQLRRIV
jgi:hypothetical protein